ncbi:MAG: trypsin-like peptidase domain-containing protein [Deltaproteobacteria bacterium]|nr:trypsin-like peptidase domain-containing protein [Deltaproteobacteria bacterium]
MMKTRFVCVLVLSLAAVVANAHDPFLRRTTTVEVVERVGPSVVNITTERIVRNRGSFGHQRGNPFFDRFFQDFFEPRLPQTSNSLGSGVVIDDQGHILTNQHVIAQADRIRVSVGDGREFDAKLIGADPNNDLAVLKADAAGDLPWVPLSISSDLMVGEPVIAIGNPFGLSNTVTTGVISAIDRSVRTENRVYHGFLQTDASINPGNSGGPLLNAEGKLVGINTAVYNGGEGIGFAIPVDVARRVVLELIQHGEVTPVWLGLDFQDLNAGLHEALDLPADLAGALVNRVRERSPAARARLRRGDVVTQADGHRVASARDFFEILITVTPRQVVEISYWRDGKTGTVGVKAEKVPAERVEQLSYDLLGIDLKARNEVGFVVTKIRAGSGAERIGLEIGDLVLAINGRTLANEESLRRAVLELRGHSRALVMVQRGPGRYNVTIPLI